MLHQDSQCESNNAVDLDFLRDWIGREQETVDVLTPRIADSLQATLDVAGLSRCAIPASVHWCLAPPVVSQHSLGADGHPERGGFLPPVPLPRRMWAGSDVEFFGEFKLMDTVTRRSRIENVEMKQGRTGSLVFVTVEHNWSTMRGSALRELQKIVYRPASKSPAARKTEAKPKPTHHLVLSASEALLFRYSALTFNAHRIHYDRRYAIEVEGYTGLVVHGPLQASLLLEFSSQLRDGRKPGRFSFGCLEPLLDDQSFTLNANENGERLDLWCAGADGVVSTQAIAEWI